MLSRKYLSEVVVPEYVESNNIHPRLKACANNFGSHFELKFESQKDQLFWETLMYDRNRLVPILVFPIIIIWPETDKIWIRLSKNYPPLKKFTIKKKIPLVMSIFVRWRLVISGFLILKQVFPQSTNYNGFPEETKTLLKLQQF